MEEGGANQGFPVRILRAEPEAFGCWPLKGTYPQPVKSKSNCNSTSLNKEHHHGKRVNLYLRDADIVKIRELTAYAAGQGERTSDNLIFRAAVTMATPKSRS
jgi:hypothetical protein